MFSQYYKAPLGYDEKRDFNSGIVGKQSKGVAQNDNNSMDSSFKRQVLNVHWAWLKGNGCFF